MKFERSSGILLHPTSLPGKYGIGDLGPQAIEWLDFLARSGCSLWQVLPLGPTGYGDSPYQCFSAFAGNPYLISPAELLADRLLLPADLEDVPDFPNDRVDFGWVINWKLGLLDKAFDRWSAAPSAQLMREMEYFRQAQAFWLDDFALFMALKEAHNGEPWTTWEPGLRDRNPEALAGARQDFAEGIQRQLFRQFLFFRQWDKIRQHAHQLGIQIIGDIPIFVAHDSADVWANRELFYMDETGHPTFVAGVPPDYFSPTGQLWGNPIYNWAVHKQSGYRWWLQRIRAVLGLVDIIRLDHFRGFAGYWRVPGKAKTAEKGRWVKAPGSDFLRSVQNDLGNLPIIAEDLGVITPDVVKLRDGFNLPGMKIIQFAFAFGSGSDDPFMPHNHIRHSVVYTGTHDNDTARGWYERAPESQRDHYRRYLGVDGHDVAWDLIRSAWMSVGVFALAPLQDFLSLGNEARMNYPGNPSGNWTWRMPANALNPRLQARIHEFNDLYDRLNKVQPPEKPTAPAE
jgi:4-alpha-glucanotransferase